VPNNKYKLAKLKSDELRSAGREKTTAERITKAASIASEFIDEFDRLSKILGVSCDACHHNEVSKEFRHWVKAVFLEIEKGSGNAA
jgi:hypothetical protein